MNGDPHTDARVEAFVLGTMTEPERSAFEAELASDAALAAAVEDERNAQALLLALGRKDLKAQLQAIDAELASEAAPAPPAGGAAGAAPAPRPLWRRWYAWAVAAVAAVLIVSWILSVSGGPHDTPGLYAEYYKPYDNVLTVRDTGGAGTALAQAMTAYEAGDFATALQHFNQIPAGHPDSVAIRFYTGIACLETGQPDSASAAFGAVMDQGDNLFVGEAAWYQALAWMQSGEEKLARIALEAIKAKGGAHAEDAAAILEAWW